MTLHLRWWPPATPEVYDFRLAALIKLALIEVAVLALLVLPPVAANTGVAAGFLSQIVAIHIACMTMLASLTRLTRRHPWLFHLQLCFALCYNIGLTLAVVVHSGDVKTPWWYAYIMYAGMSGRLQDVDAARLVALIFGAAPLLSVPLFARRGLPADQALASAAVAGGMAALGYLLPAIAQQAWRAERLAQQRQLDAAQQRAAELERQTLSRELHDAVGSKLAVLALYGELLQQGRVGAAEMSEVLQCLRDAARQGLQELRDLLTALGPEARTLGALADQLGELGRQVRVAGVDARVRLHGRRDSVLPPLPALVVLRVAQEAVANAVRHASPTGLDLHLSLADARLTLEVCDNGDGFNRDEVAGGRGVVGMAARVRAAGGEFELQAAPGHGTRVCATLPLTRAALPTAAA